MAGTVCSAVTAQAFFTLQEIRCIWKKFSFFAADIHHTKWKTLPLHRKWEIDHHMFASKFSFWVFNDFSEDIWSLASVYFLFWNISGCTPVDQVLAKFRDPLHRMYIATRKKKTDILLYDTQNTFYLIVRGLTNAFLKPLTPLLYRYMTVLWQSSSSSKEELGILVVGCWRRVSFETEVSQQRSGQSIPLGNVCSGHV